jgi:DNA-binding MarR family transcriptional regulator
LFAAFLLDEIYHTAAGPHQFEIFDPGELAIDLLSLAAFAALAIRANRVWPLPAAALQLMAVVGHLSASSELGMQRAHWAMTEPPVLLGVLTLLCALVAHLLRRQRRREFFGEDLFGEPAWDMLLDLYIAEKANKRVSVTATCIGANCSGTTGLRRLQQLEEHGLLMRESDPKNARRSFVRLSDKGYAKITDYLWSTRGSMLRERGLSRLGRFVGEAADVPLIRHLVDAGGAVAPQRGAA